MRLADVEFEKNGITVVSGYVSWARPSCPPRHSRVAVLVVQTWYREWHSLCYVRRLMPNAPSGTCVHKLPIECLTSGNSTRLHTKLHFNDLFFALLQDAYFIQ